MKTLREIELGAAGIDYVREKLESGGTLSSFLIQTVTLASGSVVTRLPAKISDTEVKRFEIGGKLDSLQAGEMTLQALPNLDPSLAVEIQTFLKRKEGNICIFEDASAGSGDPFLQSLATRFLTCGDEVYHLLCQGDIDLNRILETIRRSRSWLFIGIMTSLPSGIDLCTDRTTVTKNELKLLAERVVRIIVGAYDGEGYITWSSRGILSE